MSSIGWVKSPRLSTHLEWLLNQLEPRANAVLLLMREGVTGDLFSYSRGSTASPPVVPKAIRQRAAAMGLEIVIDHYAEAGGTRSA